MARAAHRTRFRFIRFLARKIRAVDWSNPTPPVMIGQPIDYRYPIMYGAPRRRAFAALKTADERRAFLAQQDPAWARKQTV